MTFVLHQKFENGLRHVFGAFFLVVCALLFFPSAVPAEEGKAGTVPPKAQAALNAILEARDSKGTPPDAAALHDLLHYVMSPPSAPPHGKAAYPAERGGEGQGIYWHAALNAPLSTVLRYLYDPRLPQEAVYPASIRRQRWLPGSDILSLPSGIWNELGKHADAPLVLRGTEEEETVPDVFSGSYYKYTSDRMLIVTEFEGRQAVVSVTWQKDKSDVGKKAAVLGNRQNWDYVYSGAPGMLVKGIGWADTYMYASASVMVLFENAPGGGKTGYALFKWLRAGWMGMNMVKRQHITEGTENSFAGLKAFLESPERPSAESIVAYTESLRGMSVEALREKFAPYAAKVAEAAAADDTLRTDDFQKVIKNGGYGDSLNKSELISSLVVNYIKSAMGRPVLAPTP